MKNPLIVLFVFVAALSLSGIPFAQQKSAAPAPAAVASPQPPNPDTALRVSLQSLEKSKTDAAKLWNDAMQQELTIEREWSADHPGWHIDQESLQNGTLRFLPDEKQSAPAAPAKAATPDKK